MKILNLYAGIGGNRKLWNSINADIEVTAIELDENIAEAYQNRFPNDKVIITDGKEYLLNNYKKFDFIWASPPCQSHGSIRKCKVDCKQNKKRSLKAIYPDMSLYEIIIFLKHHFKGKWVVENVIPYYEPLIRPNKKLDRHFYWANFFIEEIVIEKIFNIKDVKVKDLKDFDLHKYKGIKNKRQVIRNQVNYKLGKHIFSCSLEKGLFE